MTSSSRLLQRLADFDDVLSMPLFRVSLPDMITWAYAYPACFFGIPGVIGGPLLALAGSVGPASTSLIWKLWVGSLVVIYAVSFRVKVGRVAASERNDPAGPIHSYRTQRSGLGALGAGSVTPDRAMLMLSHRESAHMRS